MRDAKFVTQEQARSRTELTFGPVRPNRHWGWWMATGGLVLLLVVGLLTASTRLLINNDPFSQVRADAAAAVQALQDRDLGALGERLAANRGQADFAYFFTAEATPRALGDALATTAGPSEDVPLNADIDPHVYELALTDLAGTLALATHGVDDRALPASWAADFVAATTTPQDLYGEAGNTSDEPAEQRAAQDLANKQNLLLLLSRGYWSTGFLKAVTQAYWDFDHAMGDDAWPSPTLAGAQYVPAPTGTYLTDGLLALMAALTANPAASEWAFTEFQPDTVKIDGSDYSMGKFTHYLMFEHRFPESSDGEGIGMTAILTALSSAIDSASWAAGIQAAVSGTVSPNDVGPMHDAVVLEALAHGQAEQSGCSWNPLDYAHCAMDAAKAVWRLVQHWGHLVLDILTLTTFAPPPFSAAGIAAGASNATWHVIEGDYGMAGLALAAAVPGLAFVKIAEGVKAGAAAEKAAAGADDVAKAAKEIRAGAPAAAQRVQIRESTRAKIIEQAPKDPEGRPIDPNTGKPIVGKPDIGHKPGYEFRCTQARALADGWDRQQLIDWENDPNHYQLEDASSNRSHVHEAAACAR